MFFVLVARDMADKFPDFSHRYVYILQKYYREGVIYLH